MCQPGVVNNIDLNPLTSNFTERCFWSIKNFELLNNHDSPNQLHVRKSAINKKSFVSA